MKTDNVVPFSQPTAERRLMEVYYALATPLVIKLAGSEHGPRQVVSHLKENHCDHCDHAVEHALDTIRWVRKLKDPRPTMGDCLFAQFMTLAAIGLEVETFNLSVPPNMRTTLMEIGKEFDVFRRLLVPAGFDEIPTPDCRQALV